MRLGTPEADTASVSLSSQVKPGRRRRGALWALAGLVLLGSTFGAAAWWVIREFDRPLRPGSPSTVFEVSKGRHLGQIARELRHAGLIAHPRLLVWLARHQGVDTKIRSGRYELSAALSIREIVARLAAGNVIQVRVTIPEGYTRREIARVLAAVGLSREEDFLRVTADPALVHELGVEAPDLEGYLFPDTYFFAEDVSEAAIARAFVQRFRRVSERVLVPALSARGLSLHQAVTLASIVEKESARDDERPLVAAVFYNRLAKGMRLESDPTVIYGIPGFDGNLTRAHLQTPTPYNTYAIAGLPLGPIANPGESALAAVAAPAQAPYLFFVSRNDGTHQFSATYAEHDKAVQQFQVARASKNR